jgi:integrase
MSERVLQQNGELDPTGGLQTQLWLEDTIDAAFVERDWGKPAWVEPATDPHRVTGKQAETSARESFSPPAPKDAQAAQFEMTVGDFVTALFVPEHVTGKGPSGRTHFQAMLKHVLTPEEVDRAFQVDPKKSRAKLKAVANWPYLSNVRLCDVRPDHVQRLVSAALACGYSTQTATHIRNVVGAIFAHAKRHGFRGDSPAAQVTLPEMARKEAHALTLAQAKEVLGLMRYPEREMAMITILTGMNIAEICGLQWKWVNLTEAWSQTNGEAIPPRSIAVRQQICRGNLVSLERKTRNRSVPIPEPLFPILLTLSRRTKFAGPGDFVLASPAGAPISEHNLAKRRLRPIGSELMMPWLSWQVFRRTYTTLAYELGRQLVDRLNITGHPFPACPPH